MTLLLDTHTFLWYCQDDPSLSASARALIEDPANRNLVSVAACWEIAIKSGLGKLSLGEPCKTYLPNALAATGFELLPITLHHAIGVESLPHHHRDPFDRMMASQVEAEAIAIVSCDVQFDPYGISRLW